MRNLVQRSILATALGASASHIAAQQPTHNQSGFIPVTVTDPQHRFVTGLDPSNFVVLENGVSRPITYFSNMDSHLALAIASHTPLPIVHGLKSRHYLPQLSSIPAALPLL